MPQSERELLGAAGQDYYRRHFDPRLLTGRLLEYFKDIPPAVPPRRARNDGTENLDDGS
jgi:hypothetical protein